MFPLVLVALLIYTVATSLLFNFRQRRFRHLKNETILNWVALPEEGEGEVGEIIRYTQYEVQKVDEVHSRFSVVFASRLPFFERRLIFLNTLVATAPLLGLLGLLGPLQLLLHRRLRRLPPHRPHPPHPPHYSPYFYYYFLLLLRVLPKTG